MFFHENQAILNSLASPNQATMPTLCHLEPAILFDMQMLIHVHCTYLCVFQSTTKRSLLLSLCDAENPEDLQTGKVEVNGVNLKTMASVL